MENVQLLQLGRQVETPVETGEGERQGELVVQVVGCSQLNTVVPPQGKGLRIEPGLLHQRLGDLGDPKFCQVCSRAVLAWESAVWLAPLRRLRWAKADIDSAQVMRQTAMVSKESQALTMRSLPASSTNNLSRAEVSQ